MIYFFIYLFLLSANPCFADKPVSGLDKEPSVDAAASAISVDAPSTTVAEKETLPPEGTSSYVYDLKKLIIKSRENIKRVNEKIKDQSVIKRNQKREERAREYYEHGLKLQEDGKFDEAREYFEKAIRITEHPEMVKYIDQSAHKLKSQENALKRQEKQLLRLDAQDRQERLGEASNAYVQAVAFFKEKKYKEAKDMFLHVTELADNYKGTQSYLRIIDQNIIEKEASISKSDKKEIERQEIEAEKSREREKEAWRKEIDKKEKDRRNQINAQADKVYKDAVALYNDKKFMEAKKKFGEVEWVVPDYKASRDYLARVDKEMAVEQARIEAIKAKELAQQQWEEEVAKRKKEALDKKEAEERERQRVKQLEEQVGFIYEEARNLFDKKTYDVALEKFNDIEKTLPGFKSTKAFIAKIEYIKEKEKQKEARRIEEEKMQKAKEEERKLKEELRAKELEERRMANENAQKIKEEQRAKAEEEKRKIKEDQLPQTNLVVSTSVEANEVKSSLPEVVTMTKEEKIEEAKMIQALAEQSASVMEKINALSSDDKRMMPVKRKMVKVDDLLNNIMKQKDDILKKIREDEEKEQQRLLKIAHEQRMERLKERYDEAIMSLRNKDYDVAHTIFLEIESDMPNYKKSRWYISHIKEDKIQAERQAVLDRTYKEEERIKELEEKRLKEELARKAAEEERRRQEEARKIQLRKAQESEVQALADKAVNLNDEILDASKQKDFQLAKSKFIELEKLLETLQALKRTMAQEDEKAAMIAKSQELAKNAEKINIHRERKDSIVKQERVVEKTVKSTDDHQKQTDAMIESQMIRRKAELAAQEQEEADRASRIRSERKATERARREEEDYRNEDLKRQKQEIFEHAVSLYKQKKYTAAKVIFDDLANRNYRGAKSYLKRIDRHFIKAAAKSNAGDEKERSNFIAAQIKKQKMSNILAQKERDRQRDLTAQLERQRRLAQDEDQRQRIQIEAMKLKQKEYDRLEQKRLKEQGKRKKEDEDLQFRKLPAAKSEEPIKKKPVVKAIRPVKLDVPDIDKKITLNKKEVSTSKEILKPKEVNNSKEVKLSEQKSLNEENKQKQIEFSNKRKEYFDEQQKKADKVKLQQDKIKEQEDRQKLILEEKKKELEEKKEIETKKEEQRIEEKKKIEALKLQRIQDRQEAQEKRKQEAIDRKKKREEERKVAQEKRAKELEERKKEDEARKLKIEQERAKVEKERIDALRKNEALKRQQEQELKERQRREELARQAHEQQKQLENERIAIQQRLTDSASAIYDEAVQSYNRGDYAAAHKKFKDLADVMPDFKETPKYIKQSKEMMEQEKPAIDSRIIKEKPANADNANALPVDRNQAIQKTLEVFDAPIND